MVEWLMLDLASVVIDTNVALDIWVFQDPRTEGLRNALKEGRLKWIATQSMREELKRVLAYPHIQLRLTNLGLEIDAVLCRFDELVHMMDVAPKAVYSCKDLDDQKFIDLAVFYSSELISKDKCVLTMKNRLQRLGVVVHSQWPQKSS